MPRYRTNVAYDGAAYVGWQVQPNGVTVQQRIEEALHQITREVVKVHGSGRTDQGVHARRQVAHFELESGKAPAALRKGLNAVLPVDIRLTGLRYARPDFHARRSAVSKEYRYYIWDGEVVPPHVRHYRTHIRRPLDVAAMQKAAGYLVGRHDFAAFTASSKRPDESSVRRLTDLRVARHGHTITVVARGEGFLYKMVRSLTGFLLRVGKGELAPSSARAILASRTRTAEVPTAPAKGLFLWNVWYPKGY